MKLDYYTLYVMMSLVFACSSAFTLAIYLRRIVYPGALQWLMGLTSFFLGFILISQRNKIPDLISVFFANSLIIFGPYLLFHGLWRFRFTQRFPVWVYLVPFVETVIFYFFREESIQFRIILASLFAGSGSLLAGSICFYHINAGNRWTYWFTGIPLVATGIAQFWRLYKVLQAPPIASFLQDGDGVHGPFVILMVTIFYSVSGITF